MSPAQHEQGADAGKHKEALAELRKLIRAESGPNGEATEHTGPDRITIAQTLMKLGRMEDAELALRRALTDLQAQGGDVAAALLTARRTLAGCLQAQGEHNNAGRPWQTWHSELTTHDALTHPTRHTGKV
jgi:tetratricopeptide (TPR) repeat protein